jgi:hypothetical protein
MIVRKQSSKKILKMPPSLNLIQSEQIRPANTPNTFNVLLDGSGTRHRRRRGSRKLFSL